MRILLVATACLTLAPAVARAGGDPGKAGALLKEADFATKKADCFGNRIKEGCRDPAVFPAAMAKIDEALAADTSGPTLTEACRIATSVNEPEFAWLQKMKRVDQVLAWCDAAKRSAGKHSGPEDKILSRLNFGLPEAERAARVEAAMRALYGVGFKVTRDAATDTVSIDYGTIDATTLESYVAELWAPHRESAGKRYKDADKLAAQGQFGYVLLDPESKGSLCEMLADETKDRNGSKQWCEVEAIKEAATAAVAFRGKAVTYKGEGGDRGLKPDDLVLIGRPDGRWEIAMTVAGATPVDDQAHFDRLMSMIGSASDVRKNRDVAGILARATQAAKQKQAAYAADEAKHVKRPSVVFAISSFATWTFPTLLKADAAPTCDQVFWKAYSPATDNGYAFELKVDGTACYGHGLNRENTGHPEGYTDSLANPTDRTEVPSSCPDTLAAPGKHDITTEIWTIKSGVVGKEVRDGVVQDRYMSGNDKKLGTWRLKCVTP